MKTIKATRGALMLELSQKEAQWLHSVMQNPLGNLTPDEEREEDSIIRLKFFDATQKYSL